MRMLMMREVRLVPLSVNKPLLGLSITAVYSVLSSRTFWDPAVKMTPHFWRPQLGGAGAIVLSAGALLLVANCLRETKWIKAVWAIVVSLGAISTINFFTPFPIWIRGAHQVWVVCFAFSQCLFNQKLSLWQRLLLLALAGAWVYRMAVVWTAWISGWFPMVAAIFVMSLLKSRRLALFLVMAMVVFVLLNRQVFYEKVILESDRTGDTKRLDIWRDVIRVSSRNPLLGLGPGGYRTYRVVYGNAPNLDWSIPSHNNYVDIFAQTGLLGLAFFLWFIAAALRDGFELMRRTEEKTFEGAFVRGVVGGFIGMLLISMVGDWLIPYIYNQSLIGFQFTVYTWIALGCMLSIYNETFNRNR
jgi:O-antigen ligase